MLDSSGLLLTRGKTATLTGATAGLKPNTVRFSPSIISSRYAETMRARNKRSTPRDGSITCGTYFRDVAASKYSMGCFIAHHQHIVQRKKNTELNAHTLYIKKKKHKSEGKHRGTSTSERTFPLCVACAERS